MYRHLVVKDVPGGDIGLQLARRRIDLEITRVGRSGVQAVCDGVAVRVRRGHRDADVRAQRHVFLDGKHPRVVAPEHRRVEVGTLDHGVVVDREAGESHRGVVIGVLDGIGRGHGIAHRDRLALVDRVGAQIENQTVCPAARRHRLHGYVDAVGRDGERARRGEFVRPVVEVLVEGEREAGARCRHLGARRDRRGAVGDRGIVGDREVGRRPGLRCRRCPR